MPPLAPLLLIWLMALPATVLAEVAPPAAAALFQQQFTALTAADYDQFVAQGDADFAQALTPDQFSKLTDALSGVFQPGDATAYLGVLRQDGVRVYLWKVTPAAAQTDYLVKMALRGEKIAGFWIQ